MHGAIDELPSIEWLEDKINGCAINDLIELFARNGIDHTDFVAKDDFRFFLRFINNRIQRNMKCTQLMS